MYTRLFSARINPAKSSLETFIEWHHAPLSTDLQKKIIAVHVASFIELYRDYSEEQLGLEFGVSKSKWLTQVIKSELAEVNERKLFLATVSVEDNVAGFIICAPVKPRHENFKNDVYISTIAVKPLCDFKSRNKIHIGLGQQLVKCIESRFPNANTITLDTRLINKPAMLFYERLGFNATGRRTLGGCNPDYYAGYEKSIIKRF